MSGDADASHPTRYFIRNALVPKLAAAASVSRRLGLLVARAKAASIAAKRPAVRLS